MPEWALAAGAPVLLLLLAGAGAALGAGIDARASGAPVSAALLAPAAEAARLLRQTRSRTSGAAAPTAAGVVLLVCSLLLAALLPLGGLQAGLVAVALLLAVGIAASRLLALPPGTSARRALADAATVALPPVVALAGPALAGRGLRLEDAAAAQQELWSAVTMPVALVVLLAGAAAAVPPSPAGVRVLSHLPRLVAQAGRAALLAAAGALVVPLFLGGGAGPVLPPWLWVLVKALVVTAVLVTAVRVLPALRPGPLVRLLRRVALPLVLVQLAVVLLVGAL